MAAIHAISKGQLRMQLNEVAGHAVAVYPAFRKVLGLNATAAQFLSQCVYWTEKTVDGWFYKTSDEWSEELGLTPQEIRGARQKLKAIGVISEKRKGVPAKMHYKVETSLLLALLSGENTQTEVVKTTKLELVKDTNSSGENTQSNTENTQGLQQTALSQGEREEPDEDGEEAPKLIPSAHDLVAVTLDWQPDPVRLKAKAFPAGVPMNLFTPEAIGLFAVHHEAGGLMKTQTQWEAALVSWVNRDRQRAARAPQYSRPSSSTPDFHSGDTSWANDLGDL